MFHMFYYTFLKESTDSLPEEDLLRVWMHLSNLWVVLKAILAKSLQLNGCSPWNNLKNPFVWSDFFQAFHTLTDRTCCKRVLFCFKIFSYDASWNLILNLGLLYSNGLVTITAAVLVMVWARNCMGDCFCNFSAGSWVWMFLFDPGHRTKKTYCHYYVLQCLSSKIYYCDWGYFENFS